MGAHPMPSPDNPHLRGAADAAVHLAHDEVLAVDGLATFERLTPTLGLTSYSTRMQLRATVISKRSVTRYDVNGTASSSVEEYHALTPHTSPPFALMRTV